MKLLSGLFVTSIHDGVGTLADLLVFCPKNKERVSKRGEFDRHVLTIAFVALHSLFLQRPCPMKRECENGVGYGGYRICGRRWFPRNSVYGGVSRSLAG